jgi:hypothetical protein
MKITRYTCEGKVEYNTPEGFANSTLGDIVIKLLLITGFILVVALIIMVNYG